MYRSIRQTIAFLILTAFAAGCGGDGQTNVEKIKITLTSEGPLYSGSNTATGTWKPDEAFSGHVKSVRFTSARLSSADTVLNGIILNPVLQLAAPKADMKKIAYFKGSPAGNEFSLQMAEDQKDIKDFFNGQEITFVIDYDLVPEELNSNLTFTLDFEAELITK